jgi:uncharacterized lipoprotein YajG
MKKLITLIAAVLLLTACATSKQTLPFAHSGKYGVYPTKKNKPVNNQTAWIYRQWGKEGR